MIIEKDFKILHESKGFILYFLKSKKETEKKIEDEFKLVGYYDCLESALKDVIKFRLDKKYTGRQSNVDLTKQLKKFISIKKNFELLISQIYSPIFKLKNQVIKYE